MNNLEFHKRRFDTSMIAIDSMREVIAASEKMIAEINKDLEIANDEVKDALIAEKLEVFERINRAKKNIEYYTKRAKEAQKEIEKLTKNLA